MERIKTAQNATVYQDFAFNDAVRCLIGLYDSMAAEHSEFKNSNELQIFYKESAKELVKLWRDLNAYADITFFIAEGANDNEWHELCIRRSILHILVNDYKDTEVMKYIELNDIEELDWNKARCARTSFHPALTKYIGGIIPKTKSRNQYLSSVAWNQTV